MIDDERMAEKIYNGKMRGKERLRLTFENIVSKILEEGHVKSVMTPRRACMQRLMTVDEAKEVYSDRSVWRSVLLVYSARDTA